MAVEDQQNVDANCDDLVGEIILHPENSQFRNSYDHYPNQQLDEPNFVIDVLVEVCVRISVDVLGVVDRQIHSTL